MVRRVGAKVKDSCYQNLKDIIYELGLSGQFTFASTPQPRITCQNGNYFIGAGLDDTTKIKSIKDPTTVWYEEDIPSESDFITISTSIRTLKADKLQEIFTINPEVEGNYQDHWFFKTFFEEKYNTGLRTFAGQVETEIDDKPIILPYVVHHSTHRDNPHLPDQFRAILQDLKRTNPYYYQVYTLGNWGTRIVEGRFYYNFTTKDHTTNINYNPDQALHISFDFNIRPYMSLTIWQIEGKKMYCVDEIAAKEPHNNTSEICKLFIQKYGRHQAGLYVYGDPAGKAEDTRSEKGHNDYNIIRKELKEMRPQVKVATAAPSVSMRGEFINSIFKENIYDLEIYINENCKTMINDLLFGKSAPDGKKLKEKIKDKETGLSYEKYHHMSDTLDYFVCKVFVNEYNSFKRGAEGFDYSTPMKKTFRRK
jgi:PBSX family phage terminase large subunit